MTWHPNLTSVNASDVTVISSALGVYLWENVNCNVKGQLEKISVSSLTQTKQINCFFGLECEFSVVSPCLVLISAVKL